MEKPMPSPAESILGTGPGHRALMEEFWRQTLPPDTAAMTDPDEASFMARYPKPVRFTARYGYMRAP